MRKHCYTVLYNVYGKIFEGENFCGCSQNNIHWKTFAVHRAHAIMYCTRQVIQGENFRDWLKNRESFPPRKFCRIRYTQVHQCYTHSIHMFYMHACITMIYTLLYIAV